MEINLVKQFDNTFKLAYDSDLEKVKKIKPLKVVKCKITQPRNIKFHNKFFALIDLVYRNQEHYTNSDHLRKDLTIASGYYEKRVTIHGEEITEAKSISFAKMTELEFSELYSAMLNSIEKYFHFDKESVKTEIEQHF